MHSILKAEHCGDVVVSLGLATLSGKSIACIPFHSYIKKREEESDLKPLD